MGERINLFNIPNSLLFFHKYYVLAIFSILRVLELKATIMVLSDINITPAAGVKEFQNYKKNTCCNGMVNTVG